MREKASQRGLRRWFFCAVLCACAAQSLLAQDMRYERDRFKGMLRNVSKEIEKNFYDPQMKGLDWKSLTDQASQRIDHANSVGEMLTAMSVLVDKLKDSHTFFIPPSRPVKALFGFEAKPFGEEIRIFELKKDGAAKAAGLQLGDRIYSINGYPAERKSFDLLMLYLRILRPVQIMEIEYSRGDSAPQKLRVQGKLEQKPLVMDLTTLDSIWKLLQEADPEDEIYANSGSHADGAIAYLKLKTFGISTENAHNLTDQLKKSKAYIVDLRGNGGGAVDALLAFASHFEEQPSVMAEVVGRKKTEKLELKPKRPILGGPLFVLIDGRSASASEMFARHFQRSGRGKIIGDHSLGRVNAAEILPLQTGTDTIVAYGVEVSVGRVVFPGGEELEGQGVAPDELCLPSGEDLRAERDTCRALAVRLARKALGLPEESEPKKAPTPQP